VRGMDMSSPASSRGFSQASAKAMNPRDAVTVTDCLKRPPRGDRAFTFATSRRFADARQKPLVQIGISRNVDQRWLSGAGGHPVRCHAPVSRQHIRLAFHVTGLGRM